MSQSNDGWLFWILIGGAVFAGYKYFSKEEPKEVEVPTYYSQVSSEPPKVEQPTPTPAPAPPVNFKPEHRYAATEDRVYFYLGSPSEDDRKRGIASGPTLAFRYYGKDTQGDHVFRSYTTNGYPIQFYYCKDPCQLMRDEGGVRTVVDDETIMGALVHDMRNGYLKKTPRQKPALQAAPPDPSVDEVIPVEQPAAS